jgi:glycosyltransferase involved in cell wall biosynthesis
MDTMIAAEQVSPRILVIVPAWNEEDSIARTLEDLRANRLVSVVVVDDGSTDATAERARSLGAVVLGLPFNVGIGGAVQTGMMYADRRGFEVAVQFDADGQHLAEEIGRLIDPILRGTADVVIGSRFLRRGFRGSRLRRLGTTLLNTVNSALIGARITDSTSGFRAYGTGAIRFLAREYPHDYPEPEVLLALARRGFRLREIDVAMRPRINGSSSITAWRSVYYMLKVPLAIAIGATRKKRGSTA